MFLFLFVLPIKKNEISDEFMYDSVLFIIYLTKLHVFIFAIICYDIFRI